MKTPALNPKAKIGIAASSSPFDRALFKKGIHALKALGFSVYHRDDIFDQNRYFAGTDKRRADEFVELMMDREIDIVMFARGGYGSQRVIPLLNLEIIRKHPKPVIGFSDITALLTFLRQSADIPTLYGPVVTQFGSGLSEESCSAFLRALNSSGPIGDLFTNEARVLKAGETRGAIVGGCLTLINSSIGTKYELETDGKILFLEDRGEKVYVLDRMLTQLKNSGAIGKAKGLIFGSLIPPEEDLQDIDAMLGDVLHDFDGPIVTNFPAGHMNNFITLPLGVEAVLSASTDEQPSLRYTEGIFA